MTVAADSELRLTPTLEEARELAREGNVVPVRARFVEDTETPVSAFLKLRAGEPEGAPCFLLESAEQGQVGRYSFVGLRPVLPPALVLAAPGAHLAALIKPQFEVGKGQVGKGGVVRDPVLHVAACARIARWLTDRHWQVLGVAESPLTGPKGNREFLIAARAPAGSS